MPWEVRGLGAAPPATTVGEGWFRPASADELVYEEKDDSFYMGLDRTRDDAFICIVVESTVSSEMRCAPAADPKTFTVFAPRQRDVEYDADHLDGGFILQHARLQIRE